MALQVHRIALEAVKRLAAVIGVIGRHDRGLAKQVQAAASSIVLNLGEAEGNDGGTGRARLFSAAGSNREVRAALELAVAWVWTGRRCWRAPSRGALRRAPRVHTVSAAEVEPLDAELDRVAAMLYRLTRGRGVG